jgi:hypothetical protein
MKATRREFLSDTALAGVTAMFAGHAGSLTAAQAGVSTWASRIGLELYTARDLMATDFVCCIPSSILVTCSKSSNAMSC